MRRGFLLLEDGKIFPGVLLGYIPKEPVFGEVIFNTGMSGYQEVITDPSYRGQFVVFTYPSIGNYGINDEDIESYHIYLAGVVVRDYCFYPSNWRKKKTLLEYLEERKVPLLSEIDTRYLVRHIREKGAMRGGIFVEKIPEDALKKVLESPAMEGRNLVRDIDVESSREFIKKVSSQYSLSYKVALLDFGVKFSILRCLLEVGIYPEIFRGDEPLEKQNFDPSLYQGFVISNGPGDPASIIYGKKNVEDLFQFKKPILGICLGHQLISRALGGETYKLKFGHHGINQPVGSFFADKTWITSQNHGFCVDFSLSSFSPQKIQKNLNDKTMEAFFGYYKGAPILSIQYHPEAGPGPHEGREIFSYFASLLKDFA